MSHTYGISPAELIVMNPFTPRESLRPFQDSDLNSNRQWHPPTRNSKRTILPKDVAREIFLIRNGMLVKDLQRQCYDYNREGIEEGIEDGLVMGANVRSIRYTRYTLDGGIVIQRKVQMGNCRQCNRAGPAGWWCRNYECFQLQNKFTPIRFFLRTHEVVDTMPNSQGTITFPQICPFAMAHYTGRQIIFHFPPMAPVLLWRKPTAIDDDETAESGAPIDPNWVITSLLHEESLSSFMVYAKRTGYKVDDNNALLWTNVPADVIAQQKESTE